LTNATPLRFCGFFELTQKTISTICVSLSRKKLNAGRPMKRPSEKALSLGEEIFDYVSYGLTRSDAIQELAEMADESNGDLLEAVSAVLRDAQLNGGVPTAFHVAHLQRVFPNYEPIPWPPDSQGELAGIGTPAQPRLL